MIEETVLAVNGTRIATETGGKIPIGNREYQIGESVWTDGPFAFGTERFSGMVMPIMGEPTEITGRFIVEYIGSGSDWLFRVRDSTDLERKVDVATIQFAAFTYNAKGTKFVAFAVDGNDVVIRESTEAGVTETTVTLENGPASNIYCYYDSSDVLHWIAFTNTLVYNHYYTPDSVVQENLIFATYAETLEQSDDGLLSAVNEHSGAAYFAEYVGTELVDSCNLTDYVVSTQNECWNAVNDVCAGNGITITIASKTTVLDGYPYRFWEEEYFEVANYGIWSGNPAYDVTFDGKTHHVPEWHTTNKPSIKGGKANLLSYTGHKIQVDTNASADIKPLGGTSKTRQNEHFDRTILGNVNAKTQCQYDGITVTIINKNKTVTTPESQKIDCSMPYQIKDGEKYMMPGWYQVATLNTSYNGQTYEESNQQIDTFSAGYGYDVVYVKETDGNISIRLKFGETWDMDITEICESTINHEIPPMVIILDADNILFYETAQSNMYKITLSTKQYSVIHSDHIHNNQILKTDECIKNNILWMLSMFKK